MKPVNLNQARKARARANAKKKADENAVRFGRTKAERALDHAKVAQATTKLDQHKREHET